MTLKDLINRVWSLTNDTTGSLFPQTDVIDFINEAIDRTRRIKSLSSMSHITNLSDEPLYLPNQYHHLLALYATSRCFSRDEQAYQAQQYMNEYEFKTQEMESLINNGDIVIESPSNDKEIEFDGVKNVYFRDEV